MWENRDIKLVTLKRRRQYVVSEPNYRTAKFFIENLLAMETAYLGFSILELSKIRMYEFYVYIVYIKTWYLGRYCKSCWFDTSNYELDRLLPKGKKLKTNWINERWIR